MLARYGDAAFWKRRNLDAWVSIRKGHGIPPPSYRWDVYDNPNHLY
jgi:hypothetical protein